jgi:hypothetical protein
LNMLTTYPKTRYSISACRALFEVVWNPSQFLKHQFPSTSTLKLGDVLVYTGLQVDAQGSTCEQYIRQTWGTTGIEILRGLEKAVRREPLGKGINVSLCLPFYT